MSDRLLAAASVSASCSSFGATGAFQRAAVSRVPGCDVRGYLRPAARDFGIRSRSASVRHVYSTSTPSPLTVRAEASGVSDGVAAVKRPPASRGVAVRRKAPSTSPSEQESQQPPTASTAPAVSAASGDSPESLQGAAASEPASVAEQPTAAPKIRRRAQAAKKNAWTIDAPATPIATLEIAAPKAEDTAAKVLFHLVHLRAVTGRCLQASGVAHLLAAARFSLMPKWLCSWHSLCDCATWSHVAAERLRLLAFRQSFVSTIYDMTQAPIRDGKQMAELLRQKFR